MKQRTRRVLAYLLAMALVLTAVPVQAQAAAKTSVKVSTQKALDKALSDKSIKKITVSTGKTKTFTIKKGSYTAKTLVVNGKNVTLKNSGKLKAVQIQDVKTYVENAVGNTIKVTDKKLTLKAGKNAEVKQIVLDKAGAEDKLVINGTVKKVTVKQKTSLTIKDNGVLKTVNVTKPSKLFLSGTSTKTVNVNTGADSEGTVVKTRVPVALGAKAAAAVTLREGAEGSSLWTKTTEAVLTLTNELKLPVSVGKADGTTVTVEAGTSGSTKAETPADSDTPQDNKENTENTGNTGNTGNSSGGGSSHRPSGGNTINVTGVSLSPKTLTMQVKEEKTLNAVITPENATNKNVTWNSADSSIATVDTNGKVTAVGVGTTTITVTTENGSKTDTCTVTVAAPEGGVKVTGVTLNETSLIMAVNETENLEATVVPANAENNAVVWSSDDEDIVKADQTGKITAVGVGTAHVTVTTVDGGYKASASVTVMTAADKLASDIANGGTVTVSQNITGNVKAVYEGTESLTINFGTCVLTGDISITAKEATAITLNDTGADSAGAVITGTLTVNAPKAHVENHVKANSVVIKAVAANTFEQKDSAGEITMQGTGKLHIDDETADGSEITNKPSVKVDTDEEVALSGTIGEVEVTASNADIEVTENTTVETVTVTGNAGNTEIKGDGKITTVETETDVNVNAEVETVTLTDSSNTVTVTVGENGNVGAVDASQAKGTVTVAADESATLGNVVVTDDNTGKVTVTEGENQKDDKKVTVSKIELVSNSWEKTAYYVGEELDLTGMKITVTYSGKSTKEIAVTKSMVTGFDSSKVTQAAKKLTVTFGGQITTAEYTVTEPVVNSIEVAKAPAKLAYANGEAFAAEGLVIKVTMDNGTVSYISYGEKAGEFTFKLGGASLTVGSELTTAGENTIEVTYGEKTAEFKVTVAKKQHTVTFNTNGGSAVASQTVEAGSKAEKPAIAPTKAGYEFQGWYLDDAAYDFTAAVTKDITLTAKWSQIVTITGIAVKENPVKTSYIKGDTFMPSGLVLTVTLSNGTEETVTYAKGNMTFREEGAGEDVTTLNVVGERTITVTYEGKTAAFTVSVENKKYTVTFDSNGGSEVENKTVEVVEGETVESPNDEPTRDGYTFDGWYLDGKLYKFGTTEVTENITLTAKWLKDYSLTFKVVDKDTNLGDVFKYDYKDGKGEVAYHNIPESSARMVSGGAIAFNLDEAQLADNKIVLKADGTLKYVARFTGFNENDIGEQSGYYLPLQITLPEGVDKTKVVVTRNKGDEFNSDNHAILEFDAANNSFYLMWRVADDAQEVTSGYQTFTVDFDGDDGEEYDTITYVIDATELTFVNASWLDIHQIPDAYFNKFYSAEKWIGKPDNASEFTNGENVTYSYDESAMTWNEAEGCYEVTVKASGTVKYYDNDGDGFSGFAGADSEMAHGFYLPIQGEAVENVFEDMSNQQIFGGGCTVTSSSGKGITGTMVLLWCGTTEEEVKDGSFWIMVDFDKDSKWSKVKYTLDLSELECILKTEGVTE